MSKPRLAAAMVAAFLAGCSPVQEHSEADRAPGVAYASVGDVVLRVEKTDDLPNAFGRADLFGRKRDRGFSDLRYVGLNAAGQPLFRRRDVDVYSNETTMSRTGAQFGTATATAVASNAATVAVFTSGAPKATVEPLPPDTTEFAVPQGTGGKLTIGTHGLEILAFDAGGVQYRSW